MNEESAGKSGKRWRFIALLNKGILNDDDCSRWRAGEWVGDDESVRALVAFCKARPDQCERERGLLLELFDKNRNAGLAADVVDVCLNADAVPPLDLCSGREMWDIVKNGEFAGKRVLVAIRSLGGCDELPVNDLWEAIVATKDDLVCCELLSLYEKVFIKGRSQFVSFSCLIRLCLSSRHDLVLSHARQCVVAIVEKVPNSVADFQMSSWVFLKQFIEVMDTGTGAGEAAKGIVGAVLKRLDEKTFLDRLHDVIVLSSSWKRERRRLLVEVCSTRLDASCTDSFCDQVFDVCKARRVTAVAFVDALWTRIRSRVSEERKDFMYQSVQDDRLAQEVSEPCYLVHMESGRVVAMSRGVTLDGSFHPVENRLWRLGVNDGRVLFCSNLAACLTESESRLLVLSPVDGNDRNQQWLLGADDIIRSRFLRDRYVCVERGKLMVCDGDKPAAHFKMEMFRSANNVEEKDSRGGKLFVQPIFERDFNPPRELGPGWSLACQIGQRKEQRLAYMLLFQEWFVGIKSKLTRSLKKRLECWGLSNMVEVKEHIVGSEQKNVRVNGSDLDVVVVVNCNNHVRIEGDKVVWNGKTFGGEVFCSIEKAFRKTVSKRDARRDAFSFQTETKSGWIRCCVRVEMFSFDVLLALETADDDAFLLMDAESGSLRKSFNYSDAVKLERYCETFLGLREIIRTVKVLKEEWNAYVKDVATVSAELRKLCALHMRSPEEEGQHCVLKSFKLRSSLFVEAALRVACPTFIAEELEGHIEKWKKCSFERLVELVFRQVKASLDYGMIKLGPRGVDLLQAFRPELFSGAEQVWVGKLRKALLAWLAHVLSACSASSSLNDRLKCLRAWEFSLQ